MKKRLGIISFFIIIFVAFISIWEFSYLTGIEDSHLSLAPAKQDKSLILPSEQLVFNRSEMALDYANNMPKDDKHERKIKDYYKNRAFPGAPPSIPHPIVQKQNIGGKQCLQCHQNGGFVQKFNAYAPVSPHSEMYNCKQCHVPKNSSGVFKSSTYVKPSPPKVGKGVNNALVGAPPMIPHALQMRENCLSCHGGLSAVKELRVSHPDWINCRQCHLPQKTNNATPKPFIRKTATNDE